MGEKLLDHLAEDIGENYLYVKTIVENKFALLKLDLLESVSKLAGYFIIGALVVFFSSISIIGLIISTGWWIGLQYDAPVTGLMLGLASLIPISIIIFASRRALFYKPIAKFLLDNFTQSKDEEKS